MEDMKNAGLMQPPGPAPVPGAGAAMPAEDVPDQVQTAAPDMAGLEEDPENVSENVTEEEQADYNRAIQAVSKILYADDKMHQSIVGKINPKDYFNSLTQLVLLIITQVDKKIDIMDSVILGLVPEVTDRVVEIAEKVGRSTIPDKQVMRIATASQEALMSKYDVKKEELEEMQLNVSPEERVKYEEHYQGLLADG
jgi:hypothetical protein